MKGIGEVEEAKGREKYEEGCRKTFISQVYRLSLSRAFSNRLERARECTRWRASFQPC